MSSENAKIIVETISDLILKIGLGNFLILIIIFYLMFQLHRYFKNKNDKYYIEKIESIYKKNIEQLADQNRRYEERYLKEVLNIKEDVMKKMTAVTSEIHLQKESIND